MTVNHSPDQNSGPCRMARARSTMSALAVVLVLNLPGCGEMATQSELVRPLAQIVLQRRPLLRVQGARPARPLAIAQSLEPPVFEGLHPALHRPGVLAEQPRYLTATLAARHQQQAMKPVVISGLVRTLDLLLNRDPHHIRIGDLKLLHSSLWKKWHVTIGASPGLYYD